MSLLKSKPSKESLPPDFDILISLLKLYGLLTSKPLTESKFRNAQKHRSNANIDEILFILSNNNLILDFEDLR
jgi:hypothetical protein